MKLIFITAALLVVTLVCHCQTAGSRYEAANWKTWLLDDPKSIVVAPPASNAKAEFASLRKAAPLDANKKAAIHYWDAGAPAYRWNQIAPSLVSYDKFEVAMRMPSSWMNLAIYDATVLAWKAKLQYRRQRPQELDPSLKTEVRTPLTYSYPCEHSVTAAAAATVLSYFYPEKADSLMKLARAAAQSRVDAGVQFPGDIEAGWKLGEEVGRTIVEKAKMDGSAKKWDGKMNKDPNKWTGSYPMGITLASFTPMFLSSAAQFRPPAPSDFGADMKELQNFKPSFKSKSQAFYWANIGAEYWNELASQKMFEYRMADDAPAVARIYAVLHTAYHDATIAIMDAKYTYWGIRPVQYDTSYKSLIPTPPFPGYPSGHAAGSATTSAVLSYFFPADADKFRKLAQDCADSRFFAGIHFRTDNEVGLKMGEALGRYIVEAWMKN